MRLRRRPAAIRDVDELWLYIALHDEDAADRLVRAIDMATSRLLDFPRQGRERPELLLDLRSVVVRPYVIFYHVIADAVVIVRVMHGARDIGHADVAPED